MLPVAGVSFILHIAGIIYTKAESDTTKNQYARFPCPFLPPSNQIPTSVHKLRPGDIQVVSALGDSITAGNGIDADTVIGSLIQYRGLSWSIGGDEFYEKQITLPNILKHYNPKLYGFSTKEGDYEDADSGYNVAKPGAVSSDLKDEVNVLINRMKNDSKVDINNDWKMVTLFIGSNDICYYCSSPLMYSSENFTNNIQHILDVLKEELPRTLVNIVPVLNMTSLSELNDHLTCAISHLALCSCAVYPDTPEDKEDIIKLNHNYRQGLIDLLSTSRYDTTDDFTVVLQPFTLDVDIPHTPDGEPDFTYFAPDCFHFSRKGHSTFARSLWNNMLQPVGFKNTSMTFDDHLECPVESRPYIYTRKNSSPTGHTSL
ncbi:phospholipase B1, membrane-associated [Patella vulgata]|uniref:phospholipase B1, membrane-associated n=1 Tax=Patella vulgata TaxID=6465 RepID=UPI00217F4532|nr:phospholipase B1, membrane-associated [Patella vulgata]